MVMRGSMGNDKTPVLEYVRPDNRRRRLPLVARVAIGIAAIPVTVIAAGLLGMTMKYGVDEVGWGIPLVGGALLVPSAVLWWLAGVFRSGR